MPATPERLSHFTHDQLIKTKATLFSRIVQEMALGGIGEYGATRAVLEADPRSPFAPILQKAVDNFGLATKAASIASSTNWGTPLSLATELASAFVTLVQAESLLGKIPGLRRVPVNLPVPVGGAFGIAGWVGELKQKPVTNLAFGTLTVPNAKAVTTCALSKEVLRSGPGAGNLVRASLTATLSAFVDWAFVNPAAAPVVGVSPGSITNGTTGLVATGVPTTDIPVLIGSFFAARPSAIAPVLLVNPATASALALGKVDPGMPVIVSPHIRTLSVILDAAAVATAGVDDIGIRMSEHATLQVSDVPDDPASASTVYASMFQMNAAAIQSEWFISWGRSDVSAALYSAPA